jgi:thioredoxin reductase
VAELTDRPFPPGDYPLIVVGSGPGALQHSYALSRLGVPHAVLSADPSPGGMFRRWPFFQRLLSWTKPYAPVERGTRAYERYDWNSLLADEPENRALQPSLMDGTSYFPARAEMEANLATFARRTGITIRYDCRWESTRVEDIPGGRRYVLTTSDGEYRSPIVVFAVGIAQPWAPATPGIELAYHYADTKSAETYAGKRVFIMGKQVSAFELATGLLQWARQIVLASPSPAQLSVVTKTLVGVRARYVQPYEDHVLGGGVFILDASIEAIERRGESLLVHTRRSDNAQQLDVESDEVIAATGFVAPLLDLPSLGVATFGHSKLPSQTPFWESSAAPGIFFAGTITQASAGLKKHGVPANSGAVHGSRYNGRVLARHLAATRFGIELPRPSIPPDGLLEFILRELTEGPEIWHQRAYLARVVGVSPEAGVRDEGFVPLAHFLDAGGGDALAITIEADGAGGIYPVLYARTAGSVSEHALPSSPVLDFATPEHRAMVADVIRGLQVPVPR